MMANAHAQVCFVSCQTVRRVDFGGVREAFHVRPHLMPGRRRVFLYIIAHTVASGVSFCLGGREEELGVDAEGKEYRVYVENLCVLGVAFCGGCTKK